MTVDELIRELAKLHNQECGNREVLAYDSVSDTWNAVATVTKTNAVNTPVVKLVNACDIH